MTQLRLRVKYWTDGSVLATRIDRLNKSFRLLSRNSLGDLHSITVEGRQFSESQLVFGGSSGNITSYFIHSYRGADNSIRSNWSSIDNGSTQTGNTQITGASTKTVITVNPTTGGQQTTTTTVQGGQTIVHQVEVDPQNGLVTTRDSSTTRTISSDEDSTVTSTTTTSHSDDGAGNTTDSSRTTTFIINNDGNLTITEQRDFTSTDSSGAQISARSSTITNPDGSTSTTESDVASDGSVSISITTIDANGNGTEQNIEIDGSGNVTWDDTKPLTSGQGVDGSGQEGAGDLGGGDPGSGGGGFPGIASGGGEQGGGDQGGGNQGSGSGGGDQGGGDGNGGGESGMPADDGTGGGDDTGETVTTRIRFYGGQSQDGGNGDNMDGSSDSMRQILSGLKGDISFASDDDGWGDAGSEGPTSLPMVDTSNIDFPDQIDDWGDHNNPKAMVADMSVLMLSGFRAMTARQLDIAERLQ